LLDWLTLSQERAKVRAMNKKRTLGVRRRESGRDPSAHGMLVPADYIGGFSDRVGAMDFDPADLVPLCHP